MKLFNTISVGLLAATFAAGSAIAAPTINASIVANGAVAPFALENFGSGGTLGLVSSADFTTSTGVKVSFTGNSGIYGGDESGATRSPFRDGSGIATNDYYLNARVGGTLVMDLGSTSRTAFNLLWGSVDQTPDAYNMLTFTFSGGSGSETVSGTQVFNAAGAGAISGTSNVAVWISGLNPFNTLTVSASQEAFEFAPGVPVPEPGSLALLGLGLAGLAAVARRKQKQG